MTNDEDVWEFTDAALVFKDRLEKMYASWLEEWDACDEREAAVIMSGMCANILYGQMLIEEIEAEADEDDDDEGEEWKQG